MLIGVRAPAPRRIVNLFKRKEYIYDMKHIKIFEEFENEGKYIPPVQIQCNKCGWNWNSTESDIENLYICNKCGENNKDFYKPEV